MFYGKTCNYSLGWEDDGYSVVFTGDNRGLSAATYHDLDSCVLWGGYCLFEEHTIPMDQDIQMIICSQSKQILSINCSNEKDRDKLLEMMWEALTDVNVTEDECIEQDWFIFESGTDKYEIWHWFDEHYSEGVAALV